MYAAQRNVTSQTVVSFRAQLDELSSLNNAPKRRLQDAATEVSIACVAKLAVTEMRKTLERENRYLSAKKESIHNLFVKVSPTCADRKRMKSTDIHFTSSLRQADVASQLLDTAPT